MNCIYCNAVVADGNLERHAEQSALCARMALAFIRSIPTGHADIDGSFSREDKAGAIRRSRARLAKALAAPA
jgi:hypothetical protein